MARCARWRSRPRPGAPSWRDRVVFIRCGTYVGNLDFSGSRVTLFGEGVLGGAVVLAGDVTVTGSDSAYITGALTMRTSKVGLAFSRVDGAVSAEGSDGMLVAQRAVRHRERDRQRHRDARQSRRRPDHDVPAVSG